MRRKHLRRWNVVHRVSRKECERPTTADTRACQNAVALSPVKPESRAQHYGSRRETHHYLARRAERLQLVREKESNAQHQNDDAQLVQPVRPHHFFDIERRFKSVG